MNTKERHWKEKGSSLKKNNKILTFKHGGGNVIVWSCMSYNGVENLHFIDGIMNKYDYCNILLNNV